MGLVYGREGRRKEATGIEGRATERERERERGIEKEWWGGGKIDPICGMMVN